MFSPLKILEKDPIHILLIYRDGLPQDFPRKLLNFIMLRTTDLRKRRVVVHVLTNKPDPFYLEDLRDIIFNNLHLTLTIRSYKLDCSVAEDLIKTLVMVGVNYYFFVDKKLDECIKLLRSRGIDPNIIEG